MLLFIRCFRVLFGLIALGTGFKGRTAPYGLSQDPMVDKSPRFVAAIWASLALGFSMSYGIRKRCPFSAF